MESPLTPAHRAFRARIFTATWLSYFGFYFCRKAWGVCKKDVQMAFDWDTPQIAHIGTAFLVAYMAGQFLSGSLGRKYGPRVLLLSGMGVSLLANAAFGFSSSYAAFLSFMVLNGLAQASGWPGNIGVLARWYRREERGTVMGLWSTCYSVGAAVAKTFAALLLGLKLGWQVAFWGCSAVLLVIWFIFLWLERDAPEDVGLAPIAEDDAPQGNAAPRPAFQDFLALLTHPMVLTMGGTYFCIKFLRYALDSWLPYFFGTLGMETAQAGVAGSVFDYCGIAGTFLAGWMSDRWFPRNRSVVSAGMAIGMTGVLVMVMGVGSMGLPLAMTLVVLYGIAGFFLYGPDSLLSGVGAVDVSNPKNAVAAAGIINGLGSAGPIVQEELIAWLYQRRNANLAPGAHADLTEINVLLSGVALLSVVLLVILARQEGGKAASSPSS